MQEDPQNSSATEPDWVSYFIQDPKTRPWVHTTLFQVPANTRVNMTILGYDGCTPLRNKFWSQVQGTIGARDRAAVQGPSTSRSGRPGRAR